MNSEKVGVIVGKGKERDHLEMVVAFSEREKAPKLGSFLVVEEQEYMRRKFLCRVEDMNYGDFQATKDERIRAIVEKYMREIAGYGRELSEEEKKTLFFRHYILKILGEISTDSKTIVTEYRLLPELSSICRFATNNEYSTITNAGIQEPDKAMKVGKLVIGKEEKTNDILFEPWKFEKRRTAIFARTGYGKSNLCKVVVSLASLTGKTGILVLDMDGEYAFKTKTATGQEVSGLANMDSVKSNLVVYTQRRDVLNKYKDIVINPVLNLELLEVWRIADLFKEEGKAILEDFKYFDKDKITDWKTLVTTSRKITNRRERDEAVKTFVDKVAKKGQESVLRRNILPILEMDNPSAPHIVYDVMFHLARNRLVIVDLSQMPIENALCIAEVILTGIFRHNIDGIIAGKIINAIGVFEEAQNVLNKNNRKG